MNFCQKRFHMSEEVPVPDARHHVQSKAAGRSSAGSGENPVDSLFEVRDILSRERRLIAVVTLLFTLGSLFYAFFGTPVYRSTTLVEVRSDKKEQALAFLQSYAFFEDFVRSEKLLPLLYADLWDRQTGTWNRGEKQAPSLRDGSVLLKSRIAVSRPRKNSGLVRMSLELENPSVAADILNRLVRRINEVVRKEAVDKATKNMSYLREQLRFQDSLLASRLASPAVREADELLREDIPEEIQGIFDYLQAQMLLSDGSLERQHLIGMIQENARTVMRARIEADAFALKVYDPAIASDNAVRPEKKAVLLLGFTGGLFSAIFLAFSRDFIVRKKGVPLFGT